MLVKEIMKVSVIFFLFVSFLIGIDFEFFLVIVILFIDIYEFGVWFVLSMSFGGMLCLLMYLLMLVRKESLYFLYMFLGIGGFVVVFVCWEKL